MAPYALKKLMLIGLCQPGNRVRTVRMQPYPLLVRVSLSCCCEFELQKFCREQSAMGSPTCLRKFFSPWCPLVQNSYEQVPSLRTFCSGEHCAIQLFHDSSLRGRLMVERKGLPFAFHVDVMLLQWNLEVLRQQTRCMLCNLSKTSGTLARPAAALVQACLASALCVQLLVSRLTLSVFLTSLQGGCLGSMPSLNTVFTSSSSPLEHMCRYVTGPLVLLPPRSKICTH